jgi:hypothetical protein
VGVRGLARTRRDEMDVDVEEPLMRKRKQVFPEQAGLLADLAQRDEAEIELSFAVAARLQPAPELGVVEEQHPRARGVEHEAASGQVPERLRAQVGVGWMLAQEAPDEVDVARLLLVGAKVASELVVECAKGCRGGVVHESVVCQSSAIGVHTPGGGRAHASQRPQSASSLVFVRRPGRLFRETLLAARCGGARGSFHTQAAGVTLSRELLADRASLLPEEPKRGGLQQPGCHTFPITFPQISKRRARWHG